MKNNYIQLYLFRNYLVSLKLMAINFIRFTNNLLNLSRPVKTLIAISIDFSCCIFSVWFAYYLRLGYLVPLSERGLERISFLINNFITYIFNFWAL